MHIAFLTPEYPYAHGGKSGGIGTSIKNLAIALVKENIQVSVFVAYQAENKLFTEDGVSIHLIATKRYVFANWYFYKRHLSHYLNKYTRDQSIQIVEVPDWSGIGAFMSFKAAMVVRLNGSDAYFCHLANRTQKKKNFFLEKLNLSKAKAVTSVSHFTAQVTRELFDYNKPISTIHNSINADRFQPQNTQPVDHSILYFGTIIRKKGVLDLAMAFNFVIESLPDATLTFVGKDVIDYKTQKSTLSLIKESLTDQALKNVKFIGEVDYQEISSYVEKAAVVCLPSHAEAFPMTWLETLAMEKAFVSSNIGWANELMIDEQTGYMVDPSNHLEMAQKLQELLCDPIKAIKFGKQGRQRVVEVFDTQVIVKQNIAFYKSVIES